MSVRNLEKWYKWPDTLVAGYPHFSLVAALQLYQCAGKYSYSHRTGSGIVLVYLYSPTRQSGSGPRKILVTLIGRYLGNGSTLGNMAQRSLQAS